MKATITRPEVKPVKFSDVEPGGLFVGTDGKTWMRSAPKGNLAYNLETGYAVVLEDKDVAEGFREDHHIDDDWPIREVIPPGTEVKFTA